MVGSADAPIFILVSALVAGLVIVIAVNQVNSFGTSTSDHSDRSQVQSLISSIQQECERLNQQGERLYSTSEQLELRTTGFDIDNSGPTPVFVFDPGGDNDRMSIECTPDISFDSNLAGDFDVPSGDHHVSIRNEDGEMRVEFR